jgi:hypothetical protein
MANVAFNKEKTLFTRKLGSELRNKLIECKIWSLYGSEILIIRRVDQKYLESFKCSAGEGWRSVVMIV